MNLTEATVLALQGKLTESDNSQKEALYNVARDLLKNTDKECLNKWQDANYNKYCFGMRDCLVEICSIIEENEDIKTIVKKLRELQEANRNNNDLESNYQSGSVNAVNYVLRGFEE